MYTSSLNFHFLQLQVSKIMSTEKFYLSLPEELSLLVFGLLFSDFLMREKKFYESRVLTGHWRSMFVMDQVTNVQFSRIIFIAPQFVTGQVGTTVMI